MADIIDEANDLNELRLTTALANRPPKATSNLLMAFGFLIITGS